MSNTIEVMAQWLSGLWCWIYHVCLGFKSFKWQNILHLDCHGLDWITFEILRSKNKGWIDPMGLTFPRMDQSNELQFLLRLLKGENSEVNNGEQIYRNRQS